MLVAVLAGGLLSCATEGPDSPASAPPAAWLALVTERVENVSYVLSGSESVHPRQGFAARWEGEAVVFDDSVALRVASWGTEGAMSVPAAAKWTPGECDGTDRVDPAGNCLPRLEADRDGGLLEWWVSTPEGFEQGFTVEEAPGDRIVIEMAAEGEVFEGHVNLEGGLRYDRLVAWDAEGTELASRFEPCPGGFRIVVEAGNAVYPVTIDPVISSAWIQELTGLGSAVAGAGDVNGDGYDDILLGAGDASTAYLFLGSATGPSTTSAWSPAASSGSGQGYAVDGAGDVNADGYDDIIVGAQIYDNGQTDEGRFSVYLGSASGPASTAVLTVEGDQTYAYLGSSVAGAGDVNNDGYDDVLVAASAYDYGNTDEGKVFLYFGGASGPDSTADWTAEGNQTSAAMGYAIAGLGDINGDGYADIAAGAYLYDDGSTDEGEAFVYYGSTTGPSATADWTYECDQATAYCGSAVAGGGDANGDGFDDVLVGATYYDNGSTNEGKVWLFAGSASGLATTATWSVESGSSSGYLGQKGGVEFIGDANADGYDDVVTGLYTYGGSSYQYGMVYVYNGGSTGPATTASLSYTSSGSSWRFGYVVAGAGDTDGDGYDDVLIGVPGAAETWMLYGSGSGVDTSALYDWRVYGYTSSSNYTGYSVTGAGDVNNDGYDDIAFSSPRATSSSSYYNYVYIYHGSPTGLAASASTTLSDISTDEYGDAVAGAGDVNGDGYDDLLVAAFYNTVSASYEGSVYVYYGGASGISSSNYARLDGGQANAWFGTAISRAGDVNDDGYDDILVGAMYYDNGQSDEGQVFLYLGSSGGVDPGVDATYDCDDASCYMGGSIAAVSDGNSDGYYDVLAGGSVAPAGDVNGDGYDDVLLGGNGYSNGQSAEGLAVLLYGNASGLDSSPAWSYESDSASAGCGVVAGIGDVNGDSYADLGVGCPSYSASRGRLLVFHGSASGPSTTPDQTVTGSSTGGLLGRTFAPLGDVDQDGYDDLALGVPGDSVGGLTSGSVWMFFGTETGLASTADITLVEPQWQTSAAQYGYAVSNAGDVDGDGRTNLIVGAIDAGSYGYVYVYDFDDGDGDGTIGWLDCDDDDPVVYPEAEELCDGLDNDCDGAVDDETPNWWQDTDGDGYGDPGTATVSCTQPSGAVGNDDDCDDTDAATSPEGVEACNSLDDDCDGEVDEVGATGGSTWYADDDGDGYGNASRSVSACSLPNGYVAISGDCDDEAVGSYPGADEYCNDADDDCDGTVDENDAVDAATWYRDADSDGAGNASLTTVACDAPSGYVVSGNDCDDGDSTVRPTATELCDGIDNDCDTTIDEGATTRYYLDADSDGYGSASATQDACSLPSGYATNGDDCDDSTSAVRPGATETCNTTDDDCDGTVDEGVTTTFYLDADSDGYGSSTTGEACALGSGYAASSGDCDDADATQYPGAAETCNDADDDCDGTADDGVATTTWYRDSDSDGFGDVSRSTTDCAAPSGYVADGTDCDDADASLGDGATWYRDADGDGYGDASVTTYTCTAGPAYVADDTDCDDTDTNVHPGAEEIWYDGIDEDCLGGNDNDADADSFDAATEGGDDCDDEDEDVNPDAEDYWYDGEDSDCDGASDYDADGDGHDSASYGGDDCNDGNAGVYPGAADEPYDGVDSDCTGDWEYDVDQDGYDSDDYGGNDCDDNNSTVNPEAEETWYDGIDQDCDGNDMDQDGDGVPSPDDCDDTDAAVTESDCDSATGGTDDTGGDDTGDGAKNPGKDGKDGGCGCAAPGGTPATWAAAALVAVLIGRRRP